MFTNFWEFQPPRSHCTSTFLPIELFWNSPLPFLTTELWGSHQLKPPEFRHKLSFCSPLLLQCALWCIVVFNQFKMAIHWHGKAMSQKRWSIFFSIASKALVLKCKTNERHISLNVFNESKSLSETRHSFRCSVNIVWLFKHTTFHNS